MKESDRIKFVGWIKRSESTENYYFSFFVVLARAWWLDRIKTGRKGYALKGDQNVLVLQPKYALLLYYIHKHTTLYKQETHDR